MFHSSQQVEAIGGRDSGEAPHWQGRVAPFIRLMAADRPASMVAKGRKSDMAD
jgi:hypothetical protein